MLIKIFGFFIFTFLVFDAKSQTLRQEIENYKLSDDRMIENSRAMLNQAISENNVAKMTRIYNFLRDSIDVSYNYFSSYEKLGLALMTKNYQDVLNFSNDSIPKFYHEYFKFYGDNLANNISEYFKKHTPPLDSQINSLEYNLETKKVLLLFANFIVDIDNFSNDSLLLKLNQETVKFSNEYPNSVYKKDVLGYINKEYIINWRYDWYLGMNYLVNSGFAKSYFGNLIGLDLGANISYKRINLNVNLNVSGNSLNESFFVNDTIWKKGAKFQRIEIMGFLGYHIYEDNRFTITPQLGLGYLSYFPPKGEIENNRKLEDFNINSLVYGLAIMADCGLGNFRPDAIQSSGKGIQKGRWNIKFQYNLNFIKDFNSDIEHKFSIAIGRRGTTIVKKYKN